MCDRNLNLATDTATQSSVDGLHSVCPFAGVSWPELWEESESSSSLGRDPEWMHLLRSHDSANCKQLCSLRRCFRMRQKASIVRG